MIWQQTLVAVTVVRMRLGLLFAMTALIAFGVLSSGLAAWKFPREAVELLDGQNETQGSVSTSW
jgi:hypothetical protein